MRIIVIIPTYDEAENLPKLVSALFSLPLDLRILVVDDKSPDGTGDIADALATENPGKVDVLHREGKLGLRTAYLTGIQHALATDADAIAQMDADFSHEPARLVEMAELLKTKEVVLGSRYVPGGRVDMDWPIWRKALSAFGNFYARTILGFKLRDVTTGYRLWRRETLEGMPLDRIQSNGYVFLVEMVYMAYCLGYRFGEVPIYFADRQWGKSKMSFKIQREAAFRIWLVRWGYRDLRAKRYSARVKQ
ncbi:MAG: polyprenol monophosphomannose synthase [Anaerolineales bacterium]|uniref:Polyprenol monophosphomannose synthase n=1 Tax=Candidatus Desulfolinea nitratireducens TaxID=2841698 RepID=A0A8J6NJJ2_9CHLR|nr:polyprenol monophosphomannose synthase [Candidatus Desulfolinea nitratireducens]MBL6959886.1 polyprenol monophosphomannose synthase [Anaerolineales bacterium]